MKRYGQIIGVKPEHFEADSLTIQKIPCALL